MSPTTSRSGVRRLFCRPPYASLAALVVAGVLLALPGAASGATFVADFDGNGRSDLAVGVPGEDIGSIDSAGAVNVIYGSGSGLTSAGNDLWSQGASGLQGESEAGDNFGAALATGDFDGDNFADLAVGAPNENLTGGGDAGAITVIYGSASGLTSGGNQVIHQDTVTIDDTAESADRYGNALAAGDFDGDGLADLAVGVAEEDLGSQFDAGAVSVLYGATSGLGTNADDQFFHQNTPGIGGGAESNDVFGRALAVRDFNGNGRADLAVGVPREAIGSITAAGEVNVIYGSASGLTSAGNQEFWQDASGIGGDSEPGDEFGSELTAGDFNGNGRADLAVGVPREAIGSISMAGAVNVIYGSASGLTSAGNQVFSQNGPASIGDASDAGDEFGGALAGGDLNGNVRVDLVVGVPFENLGSINNAGAANAIYGSASGLTATGNQFWSQDASSIGNTSEPFDSFGGALAIGNFNNSYADLAAGVPGEDIGTINSAGAVNVIYGSASGLTATGNQFFNQDTSGIQGGAEPEDRFGAAIASR